MVLEGYADLSVKGAFAETEGVAEAHGATLGGVVHTKHNGDRLLVPECESLEQRRRRSGMSGLKRAQYGFDHILVSTRAQHPHPVLVRCEAYRDRVAHRFCGPVCRRAPTRS